MHMLDWNVYRQQLAAQVADLAKLSPDTVRGYGALGAAGQKTGHLDAKTRELIAIAVAISLRCDGCIAVHTDAARKLGATPEEIAEALGVAVDKRRRGHRLFDPRARRLCGVGRVGVRGDAAYDPAAKRRRNYSSHLARIAAMVPLAALMWSHWSTNCLRASSRGRR